MQPTIDDYGPADAETDAMRSILENVHSPVRPTFEKFDGFLLSISKCLDYWNFSKLLAPPHMGYPVREYIAYTYWRYWEYGTQYTKQIGSDSPEVEAMYLSNFREPVFWSDVLKGQDTSETKQASKQLDEEYGLVSGVSLPMAMDHGRWSLSIASRSMTDKELRDMWSYRGLEIRSAAYDMLLMWIDHNGDGRVPREKVLTPTERRVLYMAVYMGYSIPRIAVELGRSHFTIKSHWESIKDKIGGEGRLGVAVNAYKQGNLP